MFQHVALNRYSAFSIHLVISLVVFIGFLIIMKTYWYPGPYFSLQGGTDVLKILVGVDVILGPIITLIIYVPKKKGLKFDITVISALQIVALIYGGNIIYEERPIFSVFAADRFVVVGIQDIDLGKLPKPFKKLSSSGPVYLFAEFPKDINEKNNLLFDVLAGAKDIEYRPKYYRPLKDHWQAALSRAVKYELVDTKANAPQLEKFFSGRNKEDYALIPIYGRFNLVLGVFHRETMEFHGCLDIPVP